MTKLKNAVLKKEDLKFGETIEAKTVSEIKLKDWPPERSRAVIDCMESFGFIPQFITIAKVKGKTSMFNVCGMRKSKLDLKAVDQSKLGSKKEKPVGK